MSSPRIANFVEDKCCINLKKGHIILKFNHPSMELENSIFLNDLTFSPPKKNVKKVGCEMHLPLVLDTASVTHFSARTCLLQR